ncbi:MAG TPA: BMP family ABC transporter substrate-binding protein [Clostridia bacterium]|nr:BMP family ABC transporter substrate-binding protein [Clostridia bacterium]
MKKLLALVMCVVMACGVLAACAPAANGNTETPAPADTAEPNGGDAQTPAQPGDAAAEGGKLLFFAIGNLGDMGINDLGWYASQELATKYNLELTVVEGTNDASVRTTSLLDALETGGYDYCVTASWYIQDDLLNNMDNYKDTKFVIYDSSPLADFSAYPNVYGISFRQDEGSFMAAVYQCLMTKTNKIGAVAAQDSPILNDFVTGWIAGVKWYNDNFNAQVEYKLAYLTDSTIAGDYETASVLYGSGCDVVYNIAGTYGLGAAQACEEAGGYEKGFYMIGVDYDQYNVYSKSDTAVVGYMNVATSMQKKIQESVVDAMSKVIDGGADMGNRRYSLKDGGVGLSYNDRYNEVTPDEVKAEVTSIESKIMSGEIKVPSYFDFSDYDQFAAFRDDPAARLG